jgi:hypothetical protein
MVRTLRSLLRQTTFLWPLTVGLAAAPAVAQTTNWNIPNAGNWSVDGNWTNNAPTAATTQANVTNGGTAQINSAATVVALSSLAPAARSSFSRAAA